MNEKRIFRYALHDAWNDPVSQVDVMDYPTENVRCLYIPRAGRKHSSTPGISTVKTISSEDLLIMKDLIRKNRIVFDYDELEFPFVIDGVINHFEFSIDGNTHKIEAYNAWALRDNSRVGISGDYPFIKSKHVLHLFDSICDVLIRNGVDKRYLDLGGH